MSVLDELNWMIEGTFVGIKNSFYFCTMQLLHSHVGHVQNCYDSITQFA